MQLHGCGNARQGGRIKNQVKRQTAIRLANINASATANSRVAAEIFPATPSAEGETVTTAFVAMRLLFPLALLAVALASAAVMSCAPRTTWAQAPILTLAHLNPDNDLEFDFAALITSGGSAGSGGRDLYATGGWGTAGSITAGDLNYGSGSGSFGRIRTLNDNSGLRLNGPQGASPDMPGTFNGNGERSASSGWSFYLMWSSTGDRVELDNFSAGSTNAMNLALTSELTANQLTSWRGVDSGDRIILALGKTRAAAPALSSPTSSNISTASADIAATIANPNGELLTGHFRHRVQSAADWETATASTTTSTALSRSLTSLTAGTKYEYEIATDSSFTNKVSGAFSTLEPATITDISVSNIASSTTSVTVTWTNPSAAVLTIHPTLTHSGGTIHPSGHNAGTSAGSHTFNVTGVDRGHRVHGHRRILGGLRRGHGLRDLPHHDHGWHHARPGHSAPHGEHGLQRAVKLRRYHRGHCPLQLQHRHSGVRARELRQRR